MSAGEGTSPEPEVLRNYRSGSGPGGLGGFWEAIAAQVEALRSARSADDVMAVLGVEGHNTEGFFAGSGGDESVAGALDRAGWSIVWWEASYHWAMRAPDGSSITYIEGDIVRGHAR